MKGKIILFTFFIILSSLPLILPSKSNGADEALEPINYRNTTYRPCEGCSMQGGYKSSKPGPDGRAIVRTVRDFVEGRSPYVTMAATPEMNGAKYKTDLKVKMPDGSIKTYKDVPIVVHDTGGFFDVKKARPLSHEMLTAKVVNEKGKEVYKYPLEVTVAERIKYGDIEKYPNGMPIEKNREIRALKRDLAVDISQSDKDAAKSQQDVSIVGPYTLKPANEIALKGEDKIREYQKQAQDGSIGGATPTETPTQQPPTTGAPSASQNTTSNSSSGSNSSVGGFLWNSTPRLCHKHTGPASKGEVKTAMTCNSGYRCTTVPTGPSNPADYCSCPPIVDCGPKGALCNSAVSLEGPGNCTIKINATPLARNCTDGKLCPNAGCLNYICKNKLNAIWDMNSKKCGCG